MKVTSKGQVTIPMDVRIFLGIEAGDDVEFIVEEGVVQVHKSEHAKTRGRRIVDHLRGKGDVDMTTDEIMELMRGE